VGISTYASRNGWTIFLPWPMENHSPPQPQQKWLDYSNPEYGLDFEYPDDWILMKIDDPISGELAKVISPNPNQDKSDPDQIIFIVERIEEPISLNDYRKIVATKIRDSNPKMNISESESSDVFKGGTPSLSNYQAGTISYSRKTSQGEIRKIEIFVVRAKLTYSIVYQFSTKEKSHDFHTFQKFIRSVKITDKH
jgi:hypothetical protein